MANNKPIPEGKLSHPDLYNWVSETLAKVDREQVTDAFLYSLTSGDLKYRPHIGNYIFLKSLPKHDLVKRTNPWGAEWCEVCGYHTKSPASSTMEEDIDYDLWLNKWGGGWGQPNVWEATYFLDKFSAMPLMQPNKDDFKVFKELIHIAMNIREDAKPRDLEKAYSKVIKSNKGQREMLIDLFGTLGLLETEKYKGYLFEYTQPDDRELPRVNKIDWRYPVCWWRGENGINKEAYSTLFGDYPELRLF